MLNITRVQWNDNTPSSNLANRSRVAAVYYEVRSSQLCILAFRRHIFNTSESGRDGTIPTSILEFHRQPTV